MDGDFEGPVAHFQRTSRLSCNRAVVLGWDQPSPQNLEPLRLTTGMRFRLQDAHSLLNDSQRPLAIKEGIRRKSVGISDIERRMLLSFGSMVTWGGLE
jgi:hypothetical protein